MKVQKLNNQKLARLNRNGITQFNKELRDLNTFRISGKAKIYLELKTIENLIDVIDYLLKCHENFFVLGGGSNVLVRDFYNGAIIRLMGDFAHIEMIDDVVEMGAGITLTQALNYCLDNNLGGVEESIGIPATIGGATYMNASCYDFEMSKVVLYVVAYNTDLGKITFLTNDDCLFGYRRSIFQNSKYIILRVGMNFRHEEKEILEKRKSDALARRLSSQPKGFSAGSVFKKIDNLNISKMLDDMGVKGKEIGGAVVSDKHANFIINENNATSDDVKLLISQIIDEFQNKYRIQLQREIEYLE